VKFKKLRKTIKWAKLNKVDIPMDDVNIRDFSYMAFPVKAINELKTRTDKSTMFRIAVLTQTRATGLAGAQQAKDAVQAFLDEVTVKKEFEPNELLLHCIDKVTSQLADCVRVGGNPEFKVSMSTSACTESGIRHEGKFGHLKSLVRRAGIVIPPLREGVPGTLGNWMWRGSKHMLETHYEQVMKVNVCAIRENGKARIVTSGSFWKDAALQPFSHITIHLAKTNKILRDGLRAGRLGWRRMEHIEHTKEDIENVNWIFGSKAYSYSSDWMLATDRPTHASAWATTGMLLKKTGLDDASLSLVKEYWLGPKRLHYNGKFVGILKNGVPMGDPLTKTNLSLAHPICSLYATLKTNSRSNYVGNGDDVHAFIEDEGWASAHQEAAKMLGYETSELDTSVSKDWGTYCEEWFCKPASPITSCKWGSRFKNSKMLPYLDVPKIRTMIGTEKDRRDFSSDPTGKVTLLGHDQEYFKSSDPGPSEGIFAIASGFQDVTLATIDQKIPLFMPRQVNGVGKPPPFWSVKSWMNILSRCPRWHRKYYLHIMDEYNEGKSGLSGYRGALKESHHFEKEMMVELYEIPKDDPVRSYIAVASSDWDKWEHGVLTKLVSTGWLIPESKVAKYYLFQERLTELEQDLKRDLFEVVKAKMVEYPNIDSDVDAEKIVRKFVKNYRDSSYRLKQDRRENLYLKKAVESLESGNPLVVTNSGYPLIDKFQFKNETPTTMYEVHAQELYAWFRREFVNRSRGLESEFPPTDIIEDDPIIIQEISEGGADIFLIVTDDVKLYKLALNKFPSTFIYRMSTIHYLQANTYMVENSLSWDTEVTKEFLKEFQGLTIDTLIDKGSVEAYLHKYEWVEPGLYYQTDGIPWTKPFKRSSLERKPLHGFLSEPKSASLQQLRFPRSVIPEAEYRHLKRRYGGRGVSARVRSDTPP
jgi:hypothetical protein